jgi:hypothetical protein
MRSMYFRFLLLTCSLTRSSSAMSSPHPVVGLLLVLAPLAVKAIFRFWRCYWTAPLNMP